MGSILIDDSGGASVFLNAQYGGAAKSYEFAAGALMGIGGAGGNTTFSLNTGGSFVIADNGSASLSGGTPGAGSILVSGTEPISSGNLTFNYGTNYYGNGTITNSGSRFGSGYGFDSVLDLDYQITSGYRLGSIFNQGFYNAYNGCSSSACR